MTQAMIVYAPPRELEPTAQVLAEYLSPEARDMVLTDDGDLAVATDIINDIKHRAKALDELEKSVTRPINEGLQRYRDLFRPAKQAATAARALWDDKIRQFLARRANAALQAEADLQAAIVSEDGPAAAAAVLALVEPTETRGIGVQDSWTFEERNHDLVPTSLTLLNAVAVRSEIKRQVAEGVTEPAIPGLTITRRAIIRATAR